MTNIGRDRLVLVEYDPIAKKEVKELYANPDYDLGYIFYDAKRQVLAAVNWTAEKSEQHFFDKEWESIDQKLQDQFKDYEINIVGYDDARKNGIVHVSNDRSPGKYYIFDFATLKTTEAANPFPWINEENMAEMKPVSYQSRDGLTIHGYLTLPKGVEAKNLPVIINPHGGPGA